MAKNRNIDFSNTNFFDIVAYVNDGQGCCNRHICWTPRDLSNDTNSLKIVCLDRKFSIFEGEGLNHDGQI